MEAVVKFTIPTKIDHSVNKINYHFTGNHFLSKTRLFFSLVLACNSLISLKTIFVHARELCCFALNSRKSRDSLAYFLTVFIFSAKLIINAGTIT